MRVWDALSGQQLACLVGHGAIVTSVTYSPDGRRIASGSYDRTVRLWDAQTHESLEIVEGAADAAWMAAVQSQYRYRTLPQELETVIASALTKQAIAWFPVKVEEIMTHPAGLSWAMTEEGRTHLYLFTLEGVPKE